MNSCNNFLIFMYIAIDLHGTLLEDEEYIDENLLMRLKKQMEMLSGSVKLYVCTGNNLPFITRKIPEAIYSLFDGYVLEAGTVISGGTSENILADDKIIDMMKDLEKNLKKKKLDWLYKFGDRNVIISMFTRNGLHPRDYSTHVEQMVLEAGCMDYVNVTYSSVAVDIIPKGFNKLSGMRSIAKDEIVIGIADSMIDIELLTDSDFMFLPSNTQEEVKDTLKRKNIEIKELNIDSPPEKGVALITKHPTTQGVIDSLAYIEKWKEKFKVS